MLMTRSLKSEKKLLMKARRTKDQESSEKAIRQSEVELNNYYSA